MENVEKENDRDLCFAEIVDVSLSFSLQQTTRGKRWKRDKTFTKEECLHNISAKKKEKLRFES